MIVTILAVLCHTVPVYGRDNPEPTLHLCHEEIVHVADSMQECLLFPAGLTQWKEAGRFRGPDWTIEKVTCVPGHYEKKDEL